MNVHLYWNRHAGEGLSLDEVTALIREAGHVVDRVIREAGDLRHTSQAGVAAVVAAGGDGTVALVARALAGGTVPMAVLSLGTANNIAGSLGLHGTPREMIAAWARQRVVQVDAGIVQDAAGETPFFESAGAGLIAAGIERGNATISGDDTVTAQLQQARTMYVDLVSGLEPRHYEITIDGTSIAGDYLLVEVLNMPSVGPNLRLTSEANAADGLLSLVVATPADRAGLFAYLKERAAGEPTNAGLQSWRGSRIAIAGAESYHVDDQMRTGGGHPITLCVKRGYLPVLA